jgi:hypothetical protein
VTEMTAAASNATAPPKSARRIFTARLPALVCGLWIVVVHPSTD